MRTFLLASAAVASLTMGLADRAHAQFSSETDDSDISYDDGQTTPVAPKPGTVVVHLNGRFRAYAGLFDDQQFNRVVSTTSYTLTPVTVTIAGKPVSLFSYTKSTSVNQTKQADYGITEYTRLYPGFDGLTAGGLKYGATIEIRQDTTSAPGGGTNGSVSGAEVGRGSLYIRREWGYLGTAELGTVRFGTVDDVSSLYLTGVLENFNDGGWNGDVRYGLASNAQLRWPFADDGSNYATNKLVYLSPQFAGFDFGVSFEPSTASANIDDGNCSAANTSSTLAVTSGAVSIGTVPTSGGLYYAGTGCDRTASTSISAESARRRNTVDALLRYRGTFGPVGVALTGSYTGGGHVSYTGPDATKSGTGFVRAVTYDGLSVGDFGGAFTFAGIQVGANYQFGRFSNSFASGASQSFSLAPVGSKQASAWSAGASYTFGPAIIGATWVETDSPGAFAYSTGATAALSKVTPGLGQRHEEGLNAGGTLKLAPGLGVFLSYLWDERRQNGFNFVSGAIDASTTAPTPNSQVRAQALTLGTSLTW